MVLPPNEEFRNEPVPWAKCSSTHINLVHVYFLPTILETRYSGIFYNAILATKLNSNDDFYQHENVRDKLITGY